ncbi:hypothetical protein DL766_001181 [Monosporascus sp. MC13-8B]|uniref:Uncharacterized protein n=1 Tax=Monosporascus cannonballus TaxID=155416 RepID=A0ABY0HH44_9PEZI|nr:hypothetical protein DL762_002686 [Monosporascus cannonballus]RYO97682.1 hypothetical protein DL763_002659 [Monosporascus cannonballus]RYP38102.1 hypothetical protein DL766_001181 [Monosporascus sp. MC13-8B]
MSPVDQNRAAEDLIAYQDTIDPAAEAMVTDGYRHPSQQRFPSLPPYSPGPSQSRFMEGHGNEGNEMRLSEYVKGQTRAQNMKDAEGGL